MPDTAPSSQEQSAAQADRHIGNLGHFADVLGDTLQDVPASDRSAVPVSASSLETDTALDSNPAFRAAVDELVRLREQLKRAGEMIRIKDELITEMQRRLIAHDLKLPKEARRG